MTKNWYFEFICSRPNILIGGRSLFNTGLWPLADNATRSSRSGKVWFLLIVLSWARCSVSKRHKRIRSSFYADCNSLVIFLGLSFPEVLTRAWDQIFQRRSCFALKMLFLWGALSSCALSPHFKSFKFRLCLIVAWARAFLFSHGGSYWLSKSPGSWHFK